MNISDERLIRLIEFSDNNGRCVTEFREIADALSELQELRKAVADHNGVCLDQCKAKGEKHCQPYVKRGRNCPDCPQDNRVDWPPGVYSL